jgi:hypothetical protein
MESIKANRASEMPTLSAPVESGVVVSYECPKTTPFELGYLQRCPEVVEHQHVEADSVNVFWPSLLAKIVEEVIGRIEVPSEDRRSGEVFQVTYVL